LKTPTVFWLGGGNGVNDVRQTDIHTAKLLVPEPSAFEAELATEQIKSHISPDIDQIPSELFKMGRRTLRYEIHKLTITYLLTPWSRALLEKLTSELCS
jgi:hypothetical protein